MTTTLKTFNVIETISVQKCYVVEASSAEEAQQLHEDGQSEWNWSEDGDCDGDVFVEELDD